MLLCFNTGNWYYIVDGNSIQMTDYREGGAGLLDKTGDFFRLRGRLEAIPFHFINLGVLAYIGMGQVCP